MITLLFYVFANILLFFFVGYPLARCLRVAFGFRRLVWALVLGLALTIIVLRSAVAIVPLGRAAPFIAVLFAAWIVSTWARPHLRHSLAKDVRTLPRPAWLSLAVAFIGTVIALNLPVLLYGGYTFEGTPNHDSIYYITVARYLRDHTFYQLPKPTPAHPLYSIVAGAFGNGAGVARIGAESLLAFSASLVGRDPLYLYGALTTTGVVLCSLVGLLFIPRISWRSFGQKIKAGWLLPIVFVCPAIYQQAFNSNYATLYGAILFTAYLSRLQLCGGWRKAVVSVLFITALAATYPELLPIAWLCVGLSLLIGLTSSHKTFRCIIREGGIAFRDTALSALFFIWITIPAGYVIKHSYFIASTQGQTAPDIYDGLPLLKYILAFLTTSQKLGAFASTAVAGIVLASVIILSISAMKKSGRHWHIVAGTGLAFAVMTIMIFYSSFNYGKLKIVEYFAAFILPVAMIGGLSRSMRASKRSGSLLYGATIISLLASLAGIIFLIRESLYWGKLKQITPDLVHLAQAIDSLPGHPLVSIGPTPSPFYYSMWIPYLSRARFVYSPNYGGGGYLAQYISEHPIGSFNAATYTVSFSATWIIDAAPVEKVGQFGQFQLLDITHSNRLNYEGLYGLEDNYAWMGPILTVHIQHKDVGGFFNIRFNGRFHPQGSAEIVHVNREGHRCDLRVKTDGQGVSLQIGPESDQSIQFIPSIPAESPKQLGVNSDTREITYAVSELSLSTEPHFPLATCQALP